MIAHEGQKVVRIASYFTGGRWVPRHLAVMDAAEFLGEKPGDIKREVIDIIDRASQSEIERCVHSGYVEVDIVRPGTPIMGAEETS